MLDEGLGEHDGGLRQWCKDGGKVYVRLGFDLAVCMAVPKDWGRTLYGSDNFISEPAVDAYHITPSRSTSGMGFATRTGGECWRQGLGEVD